MSSRIVDEGVAQTAGYMERSGAETGHLVVFDRRSDRDWSVRCTGVRKCTASTKSSSGGCEALPEALSEVGDGVQTWLSTAI